MKSHQENSTVKPIMEHDTELYQLQFMQNLVAHWNELVDWEACSVSEGRFFIEALQERSAKKVLDVATGTGFHSIRKANYYCGKSVKVEPDYYVSTNLVRFCYKFADNSVFYLNNYLLLMTNVSLQRIKTHGDFKETYHHNSELDFFIHVAEKQYASSSNK